MIILKHLTVERFRLLREMNLHFPQRGSILIQGPNEAGKSTLLESIYFALYGEPLTLERGKRSMDDLVLYGATQASVTLTFSVGATELMVVRTIERGKGQRTSLHVRRLGAEEEVLTRLNAVNERIITEMGFIDGETLRNSSLVEQKGLGRLEVISAAEREKTVRKLLGLERMKFLAEQFEVTSSDEYQLQEASDRLELAEIQNQIPELNQKLNMCDLSLDAVSIAEDLEEIKLQEADIVEQEESLAQLQEKRGGLKSRQLRVQQLKKAEVTLSEIIQSYEAIAEAKQQLPELERQIADLERREREELPALEKRVNDLAELTRSFGTLQRMSNDLLTAVDTIKELEQELKQHQEVQEDLSSLEEMIAQAKSRLAQSEKSVQDLEEHRTGGRPQLEARLQRLKNLAERLDLLSKVEERYARRVSNQDQAEENASLLKLLSDELVETEHELKLVEDEAKQTQQRVEMLERQWRELAVRRQIEEWYRLKNVSQGLSQAEQHVRMAYQHQEKLSLAAIESKNAAKKQMGILIVCVTLALVAFVMTVIALISLSGIMITVAGIAAILLTAVSSFFLQQYTKTREQVKIADQQLLEATSRVGMMVAAREAAGRANNNQEAIDQIEHEIRSLGASVPPSVEEAQQYLQHTIDNGESLADLQQQLQDRREEANAARNQLNVTMEATAALRKERTRLEELQKADNLGNVEEHGNEDQAALERLHQEITLLAGQEGLPLPSINERLRVSAALLPSYGSGVFPVFDEDADGQGIALSGLPDLDSLVESTIRATEHELASLDGKLDLSTELIGQVKEHQDALDALLKRKKIIEERDARYQTNNPAIQVERAREQQVALRSALQSLQDSLRQRVKPLGVAFGQTAISSAESAARKQLEELQITLGSKIMLQKQHDNYATQLKDRQEALSGYYKQLSKFSNFLGAWIVPLNPFAESLSALRARCLRELEEANEPGVLKELEQLQGHEGATKARIELCRQEIEDAQERISKTLTQHKRPTPKSYRLPDLVAAWPLLSKYSVQDRQHLEEEREQAEQQLASLEEQEIALNKKLQIGGARIDLQQARMRKEAIERSYQTKKHGGLIISKVNERVLSKMMPRTEHYMQQILPLLTSGRYHDIHLSGDEAASRNDGTFYLKVWDSAAGEYVSKSALSGGAADQLSLALRLAFAIAALPRELSAAPGFLFLDEPLSSFDRGRTQALVDVVTGEVLSQHFEQIFLISHSSAFDPAMFPYHVYMDNGILVESNLPVVSSLPPADNGGSDNTVRAAIPA